MMHVYAAAKPIDAQLGTPVDFHVTIVDDHIPTAHFTMHFPYASSNVRVHFEHYEGTARHEVVSFRAFSDTEQPLAVQHSNFGYIIHSDDEPFYVRYALRLPAVLSPSDGTAPSFRQGDYTYIGADAFLQVHQFEHAPLRVNFSLSAGHLVIPLDDADTREQTTATRDDLRFLIAPSPLATYTASSAVGTIRLHTGERLPWSGATMADLLADDLAPLGVLNLTDSPRTYDIIVLRHPGSWRLNPTIQTQAAGAGGLIHWIGAGRLAWWRERAVSDFVAMVLPQTVPVTDDALWFHVGMEQYVSWLLLYDAKLMTTDELYRSVYNSYVTAAHYTGAGWPSLVTASEMHDSHVGGRVLHFRSPIVVMLLDMHVRESSGGDVTVLDWWARLAAAKETTSPERLFNTATLLEALPSPHALAEFADSHIWRSHVLPLDFDGVFDEWMRNLRE